MATFKAGQPITTREPTIEVDAGLPIGRHRFQLVVVDDAGRESLPQAALVDIRRLIISDPVDGPILVDPLDRPLPTLRPVRPVPIR